MEDLTIDNIKTENLDLPKKIVEERIQEKKESEKENYIPRKSENNYKIPMKKSHKIIIISFISFFLVSLLVFSFWFNLSVSNGKLSPIVTNNVDTPDLSVPVAVNSTTNNQYNISIQNDIYLSENMSKNIAKDILSMLKNCTNLNWTNCTI